MAIRDVLQFGNPLLREYCVDVVDYENPETLQHEIDHLNGRLFIDRVEKPETLTMVEEWDRHHAEKPQNGQSI